MEFLFVKFTFYELVLIVSAFCKIRFLQTFDRSFDNIKKRYMKSQTILPYRAEKNINLYLLCLHRGK